MSISGVNNNYTNIATGKHINTAADNASGLSISEKLTEQANGLQVGANNVNNTSDLLKTAEGGLSSIQDSLQRMRELAVQASNTAVYSTGDLKNMQKEIDSLKKTITDAAKGTEYNTIKLLDGSYQDKAVASNPDGKGSKISIASATLEALGIEGFDVTGKFDIKQIDDAIKKVSDSRASIGAHTNAMEHMVSNNMRTAIDLNNSNNKLTASDIGEEMTKIKRDNALKGYEAFSVNTKRRQEEQLVNKLFTTM